jgi:hypothetical protein
VQLGTDLIIVKHDEAEVCIQGRVPRNVREGRQRDCASAGDLRPGTRLFDKPSPDTRPLVLRLDTYLLDVRVPIDLVDEHVSDRGVVLIDRNPAATGVRVPHERLNRGRFVIGDVVQTNPTELFASATLDNTQRRGIVRTS